MTEADEIRIAVRAELLGTRAQESLSQAVTKTDEWHLFAIPDHPLKHLLTRDRLAEITEDDLRIIPGCGALTTKRILDWIKTYLRRRRYRAHPPIRFTPVRFVPIGVDTPQDDFAKAIATDLAIDGVDPGSALAVAINILAAIQEAIDANDLAAGINQLRVVRAGSDRWWVEHHPKSKSAKAARARIAGNAPTP